MAPGAIWGDKTLVELSGQFDVHQNPIQNWHRKSPYQADRGAPGSGSRFVARLVPGTQRDLDNPDARIFLADGSGRVLMEPEDIRGSFGWLDEESTCSKNPAGIGFGMKPEKDAFKEFFVLDNISIDHLHFNTGDHYDGSKRSRELYRNPVPNYGAITSGGTL